MTISLPSTLATIGDPDDTRTIASIIVLLVAIGLALILLAVWIFKSTRPDPDLLAPLEVMGERSWRRKDPVWQRRRLDELRPPGAEPLLPSAAPPELDESFEAGPTASGFDDLQAADPLVVDESAVDSAHESARADEPGDRALEGADQATAGSPGSGDAEDATRPSSRADATPSGVVGPNLDELPDDDFDPDVLAAARAELDRELSETSRRAEQLDLFEHDDRT